MARNIRSAQLETRTARLKLEIRKKPYAVRVAPGVRLGYRRNAAAGTWSVIAADGRSGNWVKRFGLADDHEEANGEQVLTFWQAQERARKLARGGRNAEPEDDGRPATVREALDAYQSDLIARGSDVHNVARVRGHLSHALNAKAVALLAPRELRRFRDSLLAKNLRASSVNRISNALRAALNLAAAHDQRINNHAAWRIGLATIFDAAVARNVILSDDVIRNIITAAFSIGGEFGLLVEVAAVTGGRVSQIANLRVADLQADRPDPRLMMPSSREGRGQKKITHVPVPIPRSVAEKLKRENDGKIADAPLLTKPSSERWKQSDHTRLFHRAVLRAALDPSEVTLYALRHSSIVRDLLANVPVRIVATKHDTSIPMIERNYSKYIADHADTLSRRAMLDPDGPIGDNGDLADGASHGKPMIDFCPDGYMPLQQALFIAAKFWLPKEVASFETVLEICQEVVPIHQYPQLPDEVRGPFEEIAGQTLPRLRNLLYQGHLKACYFENDGCHSVSREFWATAQAQGVIESGTFWPFGEPARWYDKQPNYSLFVKQSELDALLVDKPTENRLFPSGKKLELAAAYRRADIEALPTRAAQREAIKTLEPFKPYHITDDLFREAEKASGQRRPGVKRRRQDD